MSAHDGRSGSDQDRDNRILDGLRSRIRGERRKAEDEFVAVYSESMLRFFERRRPRGTEPRELWNTCWLKICRAKFFNHGSTQPLTSSLEAYVRRIALRVLTDHHRQVEKHRRICEAAARNARQVEVKLPEISDEPPLAPLIEGLSEAEFARLHAEWNVNRVSRASGDAIRRGVLLKVLAEAKSRGYTQAQLAAMCGTTASRIAHYKKDGDEPIPDRFFLKLVEWARGWNCV